MAVGQPDDFPYVEALLVGDHGEFVGESDVDIAEGVFDQLGHFRAAGVGGDAFALHEAFVERQRLARATRRDPPDRAVVMREFFENFPGQNTFGTIGDADVGLPLAQPRQFEVRPCGRDRIPHRFGGADG